MSAKHDADRPHPSVRRADGTVVLSRSDMDTLLQGGVAQIELDGERRQLDATDLTFMDLQRLRRGEQLTVLTSGTNGPAPTVVRGPQPE